MKESHTRIDNLEYSELLMQNYLKDVKIKVKEAKSLFKFRTRMAKFWGNFKGARRKGVLTLKSIVSNARPSK